MKESGNEPAPRNDMPPRDQQLPIYFYRNQLLQDYPQGGTQRYTSACGTPQMSQAFHDDWV